MKEKKPVPFAPSIASFLQPFLEKAVAKNDQWKIITFKHDAQQTNLTVTRSNSLTNAFAVPKKEGDTRARKTANAYFYIFVLKSILCNNTERTYHIGAERVWRKEGDSCVEIDEKEMDVLERGVRIALSSDNVSVVPFPRRAKKVQESEEEADDSETEADEKEVDEEEDSEAIGEDFVVEDDEEEEEEEEVEEPEHKKPRLELDQFNATLIKLTEAIDLNTQVLRSFLEKK